MPHPYPVPQGPEPTGPQRPGPHDPPESGSRPGRLAESEIFPGMLSVQPDEKFRGFGGNPPAVATKTGHGR